MDPSPLWLAVERAWPICGVHKALEDRLGRELIAALISDRLFIRGGISERYPCPNAVGTACPRNVIKRRRGGYIAVCGNLPTICEDVTLDADAVTLWRLAEDQLMRAIATGMGLIGRLPSRLATIDAAWLIGTVPASPRQVILVPTGEDDRLAAAISQVRDLIGNQVTLLVPRAATIGSLATQAARGEIVLAGLDQELTNYERGQFRSVRPRTLSLASPTAAYRAAAEPCAEAYLPEGRRSLDRVALQALHERRSEFMVFADAQSNTVEHSVDGHSKPPKQLQASYLRVLQVALDADGEAVDAGTIDLPDLENSAKQTFQMARNAVDIKVGGDQHWLLFKSERVGKRVDYVFRPDPGATYCFIFSPASDRSMPS
jgi:hypothetical protein